MDARREPRARVLVVGIDTASVDGRLADFDVRNVETAADVRTLLGTHDTADTTWSPDCVVSAAVLSGADAADEREHKDGLALLRWVDNHTSQVATVLAPSDGSERLASRALTAGITGYCLAGDSLADAIREALDREQVSCDLDHTADQRYRTLAENLPNGAVALYDRELRYLVVGGSVFDDLPIDRHQLEGKRFEETHSSAYLERYEALYRAALDGEQSEFEFSYEGRTFRGHTVPVRDRTGEVVAGMALTQDVTDEREHRVRLERQNERLDRFASVVSHDLRTPLNVVEGSLVLLREAAAAGELDTVDENVERISRACAKMNDIIDTVLTLAREPDAVDDPDDVLLGDTLTQVWDSIDTSNARLSVDSVARDVTVRANRSALCRLLENLLSNAVEHGSTNQHDGVSIRVEWFEGDEQGFAVADDGPGLSAEGRERAFEWGYTTDGSENGVGFGLSIVQEVATAHGWTVSATESTAGGARFEVCGVERADVDRSTVESVPNSQSGTGTPRSDDE